MIRFDASFIEYSARKYGKWWYLLKALRNAWLRGETTMMMNGKQEPIKELEIPERLDITTLDFTR